MDMKDVMDGELDGAITLYQNKLKWRRGGDLKLDIEFKTENERVDALKQFFGIVLDDEEREGIKGTVGEIRGSWFRAAFNASTI
jgi:arylamine N-acetyltransferase